MGQRVAAVVAALAVALVIGGTGYLAHRSGPGVDASAPDGDLPGQGEDAGSFRPDPRLTGFRDALVDALDPAGNHLSAEITSERTGAGVLGTRLGWKEGGRLAEIEVAVTSTKARESLRVSAVFDATGCDPAPRHPCRPLELPDGTSGMQQRQGNQVAVWFVRPDGQVVLVVESTLFGVDAGAGVDALPATAGQLLRAAADPRMSLVPQAT